MVSTLEEWGYYGTLKYTGRLSRLLGLFPFKMTPEPKISTWQKYYGFFVILPWINGLFFYSLYTDIIIIMDTSTPIRIVIYLMYLASSLFHINFAIWTAPTRIASWLLCIKNIEKILLKTKEAEKKELFRCKMLTLYLITIIIALILKSMEACTYSERCSYSFFFYNFNISFFNIMCTSMDSFLFIFLTIRVNAATEIMNGELKKLLLEGDVNRIPILRNNYMIGSSFKASKCGVGAEKLRQLANSYMSISDVIKTVMETGEVGILLYIMGNLVRLMTRAYNYVRLHSTYKDGTDEVEIILTSFVELFWCVHIIVKSFIYCEGPHQIQNKLKETQDLIATLKKKYHEDISVSNELHLFYRLTMLSRPTFSPLSVFTLNRGLVAKILGCAATYLIAFMQL